MFALSNPKRNFSELQMELETKILLLRKTFDPHGRVRLLRELRLLLDEADQLSASGNI